jgi:hypothetical protein
VIFLPGESLSEMPETEIARPLQLIGYFPRDVTVPSGWSIAAHVNEICSVSCCINSAPDGWIDHWLHNDLGFYNTRRDARNVLPTSPGSFAIYAYRLLPVRFSNGSTESFTTAAFPVEPLPSNFVSLGFDVVSKSVSAFFECSPLSCNGMAAEVPVNQYCLIDTLEEAIAAAVRFSKEEPEPGPYYVVEVLREAESPSTMRP